MLALDFLQGGLVVSPIQVRLELGQSRFLVGVFRERVLDAVNHVVVELLPRWVVVQQQVRVARVGVARTRDCCANQGCHLSP